jgi:glutathione-regulated potassium-efflux system ancillary protein KefF
MNVLVVHAHPYPARSHAGGRLIEALAGLPDQDLRSLYQLYPDFDVDAEAERRALERADLVVWSHPLYWHSMPALLKHWFDTVLVQGWAWGETGTALAGKRALLAVTAGKASAEPLSAYVRLVESIARTCHMEWREPFVVDEAESIGDEQLRAAAARFRARIEEEGR